MGMVGMSRTELLAALSHESDAIEALAKGLAAAAHRATVFPDCNHHILDEHLRITTRMLERFNEMADIMAELQRSE